MFDLPPFDPAAWLAAPVAAEERRAATGAGGPALAVGLNGIADWTAEQPFVDVMKTARPWTGHLPGQWGGWDEARLAAEDVLDASGWPRRFPPGLAGLSTLILTDQSAEAQSLAGRYRLTYRGTGAIRLDGLVRNVVRHPGEIWFDFTPGEGFVLVNIDSTDPHGTGDYLRDIHVVKAENIPLFEAGALFNPDWLDRVEPMRAFRFMDWMATNNAPVSEWDDRPLPSDYTWGWRGAPLEVMVTLANETASDPWFTLPHRASNDYMRRFAAYVRDHLDPRRKAYVEYSNEVWNFIFEQAHWAGTEARARWGDAAGGDAWMQFAGMRAAQMADIWRAEFGAEAEDRVVAVVATQTGWLGLEEPLLAAPLWVAEDPAQNRPPADHFDAYAVTGYFGNALGLEKVAAVRQWIAEGTREAEAAAGNLRGRAREAAIAEHRFDRPTELAARELRDGAVTGQPDGSLSQLSELLAYQAGVAGRHGLELVMYEGGTHVVAVGEAVDDPDITAFFTHLNYSPAMAELYETLLSDWRAAGGTLFNAFVDVAGASKWGSWGALRHLDDANPRWDVLERYNRETSAWWEVRSAGAFDRGLRQSGTAGADELVGTRFTDTLVAGDGDDLIVAGGGTDHLHGGPGTDTVRLPGLPADWRLRRDGDAVIAEGSAGETRLAAIEVLRFDGNPAARVATASIR